MKTARCAAFLGVLLVAVVISDQADAGFGDLFKRAQDTVGVGGGLSDSKIVEGLKEALEIGTGNAVTSVSQVGGYYNNPEIKIPLPASVQKVEKILRTAGYGAQLDAFELSMNKAAETAAPEAKGIFLDAIKKMTISDARKILEGRDNEATLYFKDKTYDQLNQTFKPIVHTTMSEVGVTRKFQDLNESASSVPFVGGFSFDLDNYVTEGGLDGLFHMLAQEEKKIRENPAARVTDLLKEVFGSK
jgi:hypothetical protein